MFLLKNILRLRRSNVFTLFAYSEIWILLYYQKCNQNTSLIMCVFDFYSGIFANFCVARKNPRKNTPHRSKWKDMLWRKTFRWLRKNMFFTHFYGVCFLEDFFLRTLKFTNIYIITFSCPAYSFIGKKNCRPMKTVSFQTDEKSNFFQ